MTFLYDMGEGKEFLNKYYKSTNHKGNTDINFIAISNLSP